MAKILIAGCGDVGSRLATRLAAAGHAVFGLRRSPLALPGVTALAGDVTDPATLHFPEGLDYLFVLLAPGESGEAAYRRVYLEGTRHVLAALAGQRLKRVFWISSSSVYGQDDGSIVDEDSPATPDSATARMLLASEALLRQCVWPATIVRFAGIYGAGRLRLLRWVEAARPVQAEPPLWTNRIHAEDGAGLLAFLLAQAESGVALADTYIGTDDLPAPQHEVLDWLADSCGLPRVPHADAPGAGGNKRLSNARLRALGYQFQFPDYRRGYAEVLRAHGEPP
jgi:nucleoside-diphosphate-sugar epimerase